jgi:hypothetical protein
MRFVPVTLLLVLGSVGVSCGGGGSTDGGAPAGDNEGAYDTPPSSYEPPGAINPSTYETPPGSYDTPPDQANAGGLGAGATLGDVCARLCDEVQALSCDFSSAATDNGNGGEGNAASQASSVATPAACAQSCAALEANISCPDEYAAALACILDNVTLTCELFSDASKNTSIDQQLAVTCQTPLIAFAQCEGGNTQQTQPGDQGRCVPNSCINCVGDCDTCICQNTDPGKCTSVCENM